MGAISPPAPGFPGQAGKCPRLKGLHVLLLGTEVMAEYLPLMC